MATAVVARPAARPQPRARDEEVLVWPDLVFVEFIAALVFTIGLFILSFAINAPLLDKANPDVTPNPSKAPWYFLNLQELLLHMNAALAGMIVPTVWMVLMAAFPYFDRSNEGQGVYFGTENALRITIVSGLVGFFGPLLLILWNTGKLAEWMKDWFGISGGDTFRFLENARAIQNELPWPDWTRDIPYLPFNLRILDEGPGSGVTTFQHINLPQFIVEIALPVIFMVGGATVLIWVLWKLGWVLTRRDAIIALFSGFVGTYLILTIIGTGFRGPGQELVWPWELQVLEGIPGQESH